MNLTKIIRKFSNKKNINYSKHLRKFKNLDELEIIKHSYDLQAGSYINFFYKNKKKEKKFTNEIIDIIYKNFGKFESFLDCGCGEMNVTYFLVNKINFIKKILLFDISLNRLLNGQKFLKKELSSTNFKKLNIFASSLDNIPLHDNSINLVFTNHAIESNKENAEQIIKELYRVSNYGMMLNEPNYSNASKKQKKRMVENNYVINIPQILKKLKIKFKKVEIKNSIASHNKTTSFIIYKKILKKNKISFVDPIYKKPLIKKKNIYISYILNQIHFTYENIPIFDFNKPTIVNKLFLKD
tara:strand:- start:4946 stop:5839 length:894 start_codon:yes stop_codon:yes gene_type:complete